MIAFALGVGGMWSGQAFQKESDGQSKRSGSGNGTGKGTAGTGKLLLKGPGWIGT